MFKKGIARRWLFNSLGVMILLFTACIAALSFVVQSYAYNLSLIHISEPTRP